MWGLLLEENHDKFTFAGFQLDVRHNWPAQLNTGNVERKLVWGLTSQKGPSECPTVVKDKRIERKALSNVNIKFVTLEMQAGSRVTSSAWFYITSHAWEQLGLLPSVEAKGEESFRERQQLPAGVESFFRKVKKGNLYWRSGNCKMAGYLWEVNSMKRAKQNQIWELKSVFLMGLWPPISE